MKRLRGQLIHFLENRSDSRGEGYLLVQDVMELLKTIYENEQARASFKVFQDRADKVLALEEYQGLNLDRSFRPILEFFEQESFTVDGEEGLALLWRLEILSQAI
ncbi:unnamed protein product [Sphagnum tenellum]